MDGRTDGWVSGIQSIQSSPPPFLQSSSKQTPTPPHKRHTHLLPELAAKLLRDALGDRGGGHAAGLRAPDHAAGRKPVWCGSVRCGAVGVCVCVCVLGWGLSGMRRRLLLLVCGGTHFHTGTRTHPPHLGEVLRELRRLARARLPARHQHLGLQSFIGWKEKSVSQSYSIPINTRTQLRKTDRQTDRGQTDRQTERADRQTTE